MDTFVTVVGFKHFFEHKPFALGTILCCVKDPNNEYDKDCIRVMLPVLGTVGFLGNRFDSIAGGTVTASRIYEQMPDKFYIRVCFTTRSKIICRIEPDSEAAEAEMIAFVTR